MIYHLRYWWHLALRKLRIVKPLRGGIPIQEYVAKLERDPEMRALLKEKRAELNSRGSY